MGDMGFGAALDAALLGMDGSQPAAVEEEAAPLAYEVPFLRTGYRGEHLLYEFNPVSSVLRVAATEKTIDSLLLKARGRERLNVALYAMPGADGAEFQGVTAIEPLPGAPAYSRELLDIIDEYGWSN